MSSPISLQIDPKSIGTIDLMVSEGSDDRLVVSLLAGSDGFTGGLSLKRALPWTGSQPPWFLLPGFFYGQGRTDKRLIYPALGDDTSDGWTAPSWDFALDRLAMPMALAHHDDRWFGFDWDAHYQIFDGADQVGDAASWGESEPQIGCGLSWQDTAGEFRLNIPANEAPRRHARNPNDSATDKLLWLGPGQRLQFTLKLHDYAGDQHAYQPALQGVYEYLKENHAPADVEAQATLMNAAVHGLLAWHWVDDPGYWVYTAAYDRSAEYNANNKGVTLGWHFESLGFVGGFPVAYGLLWSAQKEQADQAQRAIEIAERCIDRWCREGLTEWGFFRTSYHPGKAVTPNGAFENPAGTGVQNDDPTGSAPFYGSCWHGNQRIIHARTTADASYYLARCLSLFPENHPRRAEWMQALRQSCEAALTVQDDEGRFGQLYDVVDRRVAQSEGAGGLLWIPALDAAEPLFDGDRAFQRRLQVALTAAGNGYAQDVEAEYICGAPEDVSLAPTSEDGYNAVLAYAALFRREGTQRWLDLWRTSADWTLTWRKAYNVRFHPKNMLGAGGFSSVGGDFASSNNNHLHVYGCNCIADFFRLSQVLGNSYYADRAKEHFAFTAQLLSTVDGQWNGQRGMLSEQFYTNDWSIWDSWDPTAAHVQKGTLMGFSHVWCINMILLGLEQLDQVHHLELD